jgi:hypothetical protein
LNGTHHNEQADEKQQRRPVYSPNDFVNVGLNPDNTVEPINAVTAGTR